jgi:predicted deacylase
MKPEDFHPNQFNRGQKHAMDLELGPAAQDMTLPVLLVRGCQPGKTLVVTAGVHGDEFEGVRALFDIYALLNPEQMRGDLVAIPVANPPAFWSGARTSPLDDGNLARSFPGSLNSGPTSAIAHHVAESIIRPADFFLDLHSAGIKLLMPTMVGYDANDPRSQAAALAFGAKVIWAHPNIAPGRTISFAKELGIPWLYTEARGAGRIDPDDLHVFTVGVLNLLRHLSILPGTAPPTPLQAHLFGDGEIDASLLATKRGFFIPNVGLLQEVTPGEKLGRIVDLHGETIETFRAPSKGVVVLMRGFPVVEPGAAMFLLTGSLSWV